jgi:malate dehydrogenase (oxaloacetate-decarboxylating)(NADP+)
LRQKRAPEEESKALVREFVQAAEQRWPRILSTSSETKEEKTEADNPFMAVVQWEDWSTTMAFDLLDEYRDKIPSFNDDVRF